jgi:diketogulonate reductase-like aldo/keto reductase
LRLLWPAQAAHLEGQVSTRGLGNSDLNISPVGFGAWAIGGTGYDFAWGKQDDADSIAAIHRSLELGVNWIDTAPVYGTGHSEEIVASALKEWRGSRTYVFTKCVMRWDENGRVTTVFNRDSIRREYDDSLRHAPRSPTLVCRSITAMVRPCQNSSKAAISASKSGHRVDTG